MIELFAKVNDTVILFSIFPVETDFCLKSKVARSFIGRWFLLEGCGKLGERSGSRFTVPTLFS